MKIRRVLLVLFLAALGAISVASVALGSTSPRLVGKVSADHLGIYRVYASCEGNPAFHTRVTFWWTKNGEGVGPKRSEECTGAFTTESAPFPIPDGITDLHFRVRVWNTDTGESAVCNLKQRFPTETPPNFVDGGYPAWGGCSLSGETSDEGYFWIYYAPAG